MAFLIVDLGIALAFVGFVSLVLPRRLRRFLRLERRRRGLLLLALGIGVMVAGMLLPPPGEQRALTSAARIDDWMPRYQFVERHEIVVQAPPERAYQAILGVTAREIRLFRLLVWLRSPRFPWQREGRVSVLNPDAERPLLETAIRGGFLPLTDEPPKEVVLGSLIFATGKLPSEWNPSIFRELQGPGFVKATINFRVEPVGMDGGKSCRVTTETRVFATDRASLRRFAAYWRVIYPGSWTIRYFWLRAIRDRAERTPVRAWVGVPF